jgi:hypothetical protein
MNTQIISDRQYLEILLSENAELKSVLASEREYAESLQLENAHVKKQLRLKSLIEKKLDLERFKSVVWCLGIGTFIGFAILPPNPIAAWMPHQFQSQMTSTKCGVYTVYKYLGI